MLKVCLVSQEYPQETDFGGIATYMYYLSKGLAEKKCKVFVICRSYKNEYKEVNGLITVYRLFEENEYAYRKKVSDMVATLVKEEHIDIIESPEWGADLIDYYKRYKNMLKVPVVIKLHTPYFLWAKYNKIANGPYIKEIEEWEKKIVLDADGIFSCSNELKKIVVAEYGIDEKDIDIIPNMIEIDNNSNIDVNTEFDEKTICYLGSLEQRKGVLILAAAFNKVKKIVPEAHINFIGRDTKRNDRNISTKEYILQIIEEKEGCTFQNHIPNSEVSRYIKKSNLLVFPSIFENFPYVVLEAMKCGKAIIGSANGGIKEMFEDKVSGLLYTPPNIDELSYLMCKVILNSMLAKSLGDNARRTVTRFDVNNIIRKQLNFYKKIIKKG